MARTVDDRLATISQLLRSASDLAQSDPASADMLRQSARAEQRKLRNVQKPKGVAKKGKKKKGARKKKAGTGTIKVRG